MPTFRDKSSTFDYISVGDHLQAYLSENDIVWVQKAHSAASSASYSFEKKGNVIGLSSDFDINCIIPYATLLVTDFSSVAADAMFYYKPIVYYTPDYEEYMKTDRGFVLDPHTVMMGDQAATETELIQCIEKKISKTFIPSDRYLATRLKYWGPDKTMDSIWNDIINDIF